MTQKKEIEIKLRVTDLRALRARLRALRARQGRRVHEYNVLFDTPEQRLRRADQLLRLRLNDGAGVLTWKGKSLPAPGGRAGKYKVRSEVEFQVSDPWAAAAVLHALGYQPAFRYEKFRTEVLLPALAGAHVCLDETPLGAFLEIEGQPAAIDRAARRLGYAPEAYETRSYLALYAEHCRRQGLPLGDFVFARRKKLKKTSVWR
jgi:adenylate cyclase class 2